MPSASPICVSIEIPHAVNKMHNADSLVEVIEAVAAQYNGTLVEAIPMGDRPIAEINFDFPNKADATDFLHSNFATHFRTSRDFTLYCVKLQPPECLPYYAAVASTVIQVFPAFQGNIAFLPHSSGQRGNFVIATPVSDDSLACDFIEKSGHTVEALGKLAVENEVGNLQKLHRDGMALLKAQRLTHLNM